MARHGTSRTIAILRWVRIVLGVLFAALGAGLLFVSVSSLDQHDYVRMLVHSASGLFLVASATTLLRGEVAE